jgi:hypothetical protein
MSLSPREIAAQALIREEKLIQDAIGHFIYWFSQLEFTIKARLAGALDLPEDLFDIIIGPYDFACSARSRSGLSCAVPLSRIKLKSNGTSTTARN